MSKVTRRGEERDYHKCGKKLGDQRSAMSDPSLGKGKIWEISCPEKKIWQKRLTIHVAREGGGK